MHQQTTREPREPASEKDGKAKDSATSREAEAKVSFPSLQAMEAVSARQVLAKAAQKAMMAVLDRSGRDSAQLEKMRPRRHYNQMESVNKDLENVKVSVDNRGPQASLEMLPDLLSHLPPFNRLRACLHWWEKHAPPFVLSLIKMGVEPNFQGKDLKPTSQKKDIEEIKLAEEVMKEYVEAKAAKEVTLQGLRYLVPWFVIEKIELG